MISSEYLLQVVKRAVTVPASQPLLTNADILAMADEKIKSRLIPLIESFDTDFFIRKDSISLVGSQDYYDIPYRAIGRGLRDIQLLDAQQNIRSLPLIALEEQNYFTMSSDISGFYFEGDRIKMVPKVPSNVTGMALVLYWRLAPSKLIEVSDVGTVTSVAYDVGGFDEVTLQSLPSFATAGTLIDFVKKKSGSSILDFDRTIQAVVGTTLRFTAGQVPTTLVAGDYVCPQEYSPVVNNLPDECISLLKSHTCQSILEAIGDFQAADRVAKMNIPDEEKDFKSLMSPRIDGEPVIVINRRSLVRGNKFSQRRWIGPP
jgi:hypothetical protein